MDRDLSIGGSLAPRLRDVYSSGETARPGVAPNGRNNGRPRTDRVTLSEQGRELAMVLRVLQDVPDVREERVAELRRLIAEGKYSVDAVALAKRLLGVEG